MYASQDVQAVSVDPPAPNRGDRHALASIRFSLACVATLIGIVSPVACVPFPEHSHVPDAERGRIRYAGCCSDFLPVASHTESGGVDALIRPDKRLGRGFLVTAGIGVPRRRTLMFRDDHIRLGLRDSEQALEATFQEVRG